MPTVHEAKTNLSRLIEQAERGEDVVIARGKTPVVRLVLVQPHSGARPLGLFKDKYKIGPEFFEPLPQDELAAWEA